MPVKYYTETEVDVLKTQMNIFLKLYQDIFYRDDIFGKMLLIFD